MAKHKNIIKKAKKYSNIKEWIQIFEIFYKLFFVFFAFFYLSEKIILFSSFLTNFVYIKIIVYVFLFFLSYFLFILPLNYFSEYIIEHKFGLSSEHFLNWLKFKFKEFITISVLGMIFIVLFYFILFNFNYWWLIAFALFFLVSLLITFIFPKIISFFYTLEAIDNPEIQKSIKEIILSGNLKLEGVYKIGLSKRTKKANAALTGIGKSKKVLISDTLLNSEAGIEGIKAVIAHEVGHYVKLHMNKLILIELVLNYFLFYLIYRISDYFINIFSYGTISDLVNFPVLIFLFSVVNLFFTPIYNFFSRSFEYQADKYAAGVVGKKTYIDMLNKLSKKNLMDKKPLRILEILFHSHPCIKNRIDALS